MGNSSGSAAETTEPGTWACELVKAPRSTIETNALLGLTLRVPGHPLLLRVSETGLRLTDRRVLSKKENEGKAVCDYPLVPTSGANQVLNWKEKGIDKKKKEFAFTVSEGGQRETFVLLTKVGAEIVAAIEAVVHGQLSAGQSRRTLEEPSKHQPEPEPEFMR